MPTELDALQLNITASTSGTERSIERLATKLTSLSNAIGAFNASGFQQMAGNIVQSLNDIKTIADSTDTTALKNIASGIRSLASATKNLSDGSNVKTYLNNVASGLSAIAGANVDLSGVTNMMNSMNRLGSGGNIPKVGDYLQRIATGISAFQGVTIPNLAGIAEFTAALRSLGSKSLGAAGANLQSLVPQLMQLQGLSLGNVTGLNELAQALSVFGRATSQRALDSSAVTRFATAYRQLIVALSTAPAVSRNVIDLTSALARFVQGLNNIPRSSTQASRGLHLFGNAAVTTQKKLVSLAAIIGKIYATYFLLFRAFRLLKKGIDISSDLKEVQNVVDTTFGDMTDKVEEFSKSAIENFGMSELSAKKYAARFQSMGTAMGLTGKQVENAQKKLNKINPELAARGYSDTADSVADMSINITKLTADMASFYNVAQEDVAKDLESIWTGQTRPLRAYGLDLTNLTLQEWALKNGIDANVKSMSQAEKTLLRYQYVLANTSAAQGDFAKTSAKHNWRAA